MADSLLDLIANSAQAKLAPQGGYGQQTGVGNFLNALLPTLSGAFPNSPLLRGLEAGRQSQNTRNYNQYLVNQALADRNLQQQTNINDAGIYAAGTGQQIANPKAGFDKGLAGNFLKAIRATAQADNNNAYLNGNPLQQDRYGDLSDDLVKHYKDRQAAVADTTRKIDFLTEVLNENNMLNAKPGEGVMQADPRVLAAKIGKSDLYSKDPFGIGALSDAAFGTGVSFRNNEQDNTNTQYSNKTTREHYERADKTDRDIYQATKEGLGGYGKSAGAGAQPNEATRAYEAWKSGVLSNEDYAATLGATAGTKAPGAKELEYMDNLEKEYNAATSGSQGFFGVGASAPNPQRQEVIAKKYNSLARRYGLPSLGATFGGGQAQSLQGAGQSMGSGFGKWKEKRG